MGHHTRQRLCNNPSPSHGGLKCQGLDTDTESCLLPGCTEDQYLKMIKDNPLRVDQFDILRAMHKKINGLSEMCLVNECQYNKLENVIQDKTEAMEYWNALHCVKYAVGCPVGGGWTQWGSWSPCTALCGLGSKFRQRNCTNPPPSSQKLSCQGENFQSMSCSGISCAPRLDGVWSSWNTWSTCSVECGSGFRTRVRQCLKKPEKRETHKIKMMEGKSNRKIRDLDIINMCSGANKEVEPCHNQDCAVDGQWSGWESWLPCSAECGIGSQSRSRSCSAPPPQGSGKLCTGLVTEVRHCFERPCTVKRHHVAILVGKGSILYSSAGRPSRLLHMYIRFKPQNSFGTLVYRYTDGCMDHNCDYVSLALEGGFLVLNALVSGCSVITISSNKINNDEWHEAMFTVTGVVITLRVDNSPERSTSKFKCQPVQPNLDQSMRIGDRFQGQIERVTVNYTPLRLRKLNVKGSKAHETGAAPYGTSGVQYHVGDSEEGYVKLVGKEMIRAPCPANPNKWQVEIAIKPEKLSAVLLYIQGDTADDHIFITLDSGRVKLRYKYIEDQSVAESSVEILPGKWLSLYVNKKEIQGDIGMSVNGETRIVLPLTIVGNDSQIPMTCKDDIMVGDVTNEVEKLLKSQYSGIVVESLTGILGFLAIDGVAVDVESLALEQQRGLKFSSRTASISEKYEEVVMLIGQQLVLTCLYDTESSKTKNKKAVWLHLDIPVKVETEHNPESASYTVKDDGHLTHITASSYSTKEAVEGFYLCWVHQKNGGYGKVLLAYGVTVVDPAVEFSTISVEAMETVAILSFVVLVIYIAVMLLHVATSTNEKFGLYRSILRRFRAEEITEEDKIKAMLDIIRSPQGLLILGSPEEVVKSEEKLLQTIRLKGGEDVVNLSQSPIHLSLSDADLPPIPRHRKKEVVSADKSANSLFPKFKKYKSILKVHGTDKGRFIDEHLDSLKPLIKNKESSSHYKHSNDLIKTGYSSKKKAVKEFVKTAGSKSIGNISEYKNDKIYDKDVPKKQNLKHSATESTQNSVQPNLILESKNSLNDHLEKYSDLENLVQIEQDSLQEPFDYDLFTLLPEPKTLSEKEINLKGLDQIDIKPSLIKQKESPTKKVQRLFDDTKKIIMNNKSVPKEDEEKEGKKLVDSSISNVLDYNCTPVKLNESSNFDVKHIEKQSAPIKTKPLARKHLQREANKGVKRTDNILLLHGVKNSENLSHDKLRKKKVKTKIRTRKKEDKYRPTVKVLSNCKSLGDSTESTRSIPTLAKMSEHHLILDDSVNDVL